jgi:hypothetical protein
MAIKFIQIRFHLVGEKESSAIDRLYQIILYLATRSPRSGDLSYSAANAGEDLDASLKKIQGKFVVGNPYLPLCVSRLTYPKSNGNAGSRKRCKHGRGRPCQFSDQFDGLRVHFVRRFIASYMRSAQFIGLRDTSKKGYQTRLEQIRVDHGHRAVAGLNRDRINSFILAPYADRPGAMLDILKKMRILIAHAIEKGWLKYDPSLGIKRPKSKPVRRWRDSEMAAFEARWPLGTKQRTAYELMLNVGTARVDVHMMTWSQIDTEGVQYTRRKSGEHVDIGMSKTLRAALDATPRSHVVIITTEFGRPYTVDGFSGFMRDAMKAAGLPSTADRTVCGKRSATNWPIHARHSGRARPHHARAGPQLQQRKQSEAGRAAGHRTAGRP